MIFLTVPFAEKDQAKALGARWNAAQKKWYVPEGGDSTVFAKWNPQSGGASSDGKADSTRSKAGATPSSMMEIGLTITGAQYVKLEHGCIPWEPCPQCDAQIAARK